ncbi:pyridoxal phosphate-dependent aminotransferase [soil metagenome]
MPKFPHSITSKLPDVGTTIFTIMSGLANETGAINLSQGFPNFPASEKLISLVQEQMKKGFNQYAPMQGIMPLREILCEKASMLYGALYAPDSEITITSGGTQALYTAIAAIIRKGDEVVIIEPAYDSYIPAIEMHGGIVKSAQVKSPDFNINWNQVRSLISVHTKMIIINTPHNPTGSVMAASDMEELQRITEGTEIIIVSDEVYEHIIFDNLRHESVMRYPKLAERSFVIYSFGKTYHTTGWKLGYCFAPANLMVEFRKVHQFNVFSANTPIQYALAEYIRNSSDYLGLPEFFQEKRDFFNNALSQSRFTLKAASGSYFQLLDYSNITDEKDTDFAIRMTREFKVASIPVSVFYSKPPDQKVLRFCFAKTNETLEMAAEKLCKI